VGNKYSQHKAASAASDTTVESTSQAFNFDSSLKTEWLNSEEAAIFLRISVKALRNMTSNGQLPFYKLRRRNCYRKDELETLLRSQKRGMQWE